MNDRSESPGDFDDTWRKLLGLDESFSVKSHYPGFKAAERDLVESEARLRTMFEAVPFDLFLIGADGRYVLHNESFRKHVGDLIGRRPGDVPVHGSLAGQCLEFGCAELADEGVQDTFRVGGGADARWILAIRSPVLVSGARAGVVGVNIDITDQKNAEDSLRALNENLERIVEARTDDLRRANEELEARRVSLERALAELRNTQERLVQSRYQASVGRVLAAIAHELNSPLASTESAASHLASIHGEAARAISALRSLPEPLAALVDRILSRQANVPYVGLPRRRGLAERLAAAGCAEADDLADDLCDLGEADLRDDDLALVAGPGGTGAVRVAWVLGSMFGSSSLAATSARRSADVVRSLNAYLELARPDGSPLVDFDIAGRLRRCAAYGSTEACPLVFDLEEGLRAYGDPERLDLVWENLVKNALFAAGKAGKVMITARSDDTRTVVSVEDNGAGVDPAVRDRLFEPLVSTKALEEGKGLGLDICRRIVETHGGTISFESAPGRTVFTVRLPGRPDGTIDG